MGSNLTEKRIEGDEVDGLKSDREADREERGVMSSSLTEKRIEGGEV